jgi:hypothetical protein
MPIRSPGAWFVTIAVAALSLGDAAAQGQPVHTGSSIPVYLWFIGAGILGLAIAYGILRNRGRTRAEKQLTENATKDVYQAEERKRRGF